jgi:NADH pyrophosphatase NudC (nudix superfamily)
MRFPNAEPIPCPNAEPIPCPKCGNELRPIYQRVRYRPMHYACDACRARASRARNRNKHRICKGCGVEFITTRTDAATCSAACRQKLYRARLAAQ